MHSVQVLSGLLPVREPDLRSTNATKNSQLATKVPLLPLDSVSCRHHPQLCSVRDSRMVLRPCFLWHCGLHLQIHRI